MITNDTVRTSTVLVVESASASQTSSLRVSAADFESGVFRRSLGDESAGAASASMPAASSPVLINRLSASSVAAAAAVSDVKPAVVYAESVLKDLKQLEMESPRAGLSSSANNEQNQLASSFGIPESPSSYSEQSSVENGSNGAPSLSRRKSAFALFRHQVAGHLPLFWSHGKICKPAFPTEIDFYLHVKDKLPSIVPFIPQFMDIVQLIHLSSMADSMSGRDSSTTKEVKGDDDSQSAKWGVLGVNDELQSKINKLDNRYLVLQDLTYGYKRPCILDLKLGTRQHGLNASEAKVKSKTAKVNSTTSKTLGLRVCGMQVYMPWKNEFIFRDKYYGRSLDDEKFESTLFSYFHNGYHLRTDCMRVAIERLKGLKDVMQLQDSYVFYACSILLIYEGYVSHEEFESGLLSHGNRTELPSISIVPQIRQVSDKEMSDPRSPSDSQESKPLVADMRLIDFAHTYSLEDGVKDEDSGVVYGLDKLIGMLEKFLDANEKTYKSS